MRTYNRTPRDKQHQQEIEEGENEAGETNRSGPTQLQWKFAENEAHGAENRTTTAGAGAQRIEQKTNPQTNASSAESRARRR